MLLFVTQCPRDRVGNKALGKSGSAGASAELCQGIRFDQFTCLIGYSVQYESMTGFSFIS